MSSGFKLLIPCAFALSFAAACLPDLDGLSSEYVAAGGASGGGSSEGGANNNGGGAPALPACSNLMRDSNESDVDCGGSSKCDRCAAKSKCTQNRDCETGFCNSAKLCAEPKCNDEVKNGDETGVDCGGGCPACDLGVACTDNADCSGQYCADSVCGDHCVSEKRESDETDIDCGGSCSPCADKKRCLQASDCASRVCSNNLCQVPSCDDLIKNQDESDKDCGGTACSATKPCDVGLHCNSEADCESWICSKAGKCTPDIIVAANEVIDDFEDGDYYLPTSPALEGRVGGWYPFGDGTGTTSYDVVAINRGASKKGFETKGKDFVTWGSGVGTDFAAAKASYDASAYTGITFWARAATALSLIVVLPDVDTAPQGNLCTSCDHHYNKAVSVTTSWQRFTVRFADLVLEPGTVPAPTAFKPKEIVSLQLRLAPGQTYDVFLDDIAFVK